MPSIKDYFHLIVPEYIPMSITSILVGAVATTGFLPDFRFFLATLVFVFIVGAFNAFNAIADKEIDRINRSDRPLPAKKLTENEALWFAISLYFMAIMLSFLINFEFLLITFGSIVLTTAYSYPSIDLKKKFVLGTLSVTIFYAILSPLAGWALYPSQPIPFPIIFFLFFFGFSLAISKDFADVPGDSFHRVSSFPVKLGNFHSVGVIFLGLIFSFGFLIFLIFQKILAEKFYLLLIFFPFLLFNVNKFRSKSSYFNGNHIFLKTVGLIILLEFAIIFIKLI